MTDFMDEAIKEANLGLKEGGIPIGAVLVYENKIIGRGHNRRVQNNSSILHAEMDALENAGRLTSNIYKNCELYTTLSPCIMCSGAVLLYKIKKVVIGENKTFLGAEDLLMNNGVAVEVLNDERCVKMMEEFIGNNPKLWNEDIGE
ncbi:nucleoside deaminase [Methanococcus maripaludis]|uniref:Cytosine deaminase n=1 Tax=Methanococcus maripaludis TaxID=39152 RepID=A0A2L1C8B6_METMI|nr:nucleoside deaminase [Methanococcus maripaludis]AVB75543.1 tRNA-specific adenosine deaminase [Methanococcus maripaludis]MBA2863868.1 cytosine deaminase [Methanococcus maripaludis]MBB6496126.1 cytosine deaminase [Methanococcus maripaludis]